MNVQYTDRIPGTTTVISNTVIRGLSRFQSDDADVFVIHEHGSMSGDTIAVTWSNSEIFVI